MPRKPRPRTQAVTAPPSAPPPAAAPLPRRRSHRLALVLLLPLLAAGLFFMLHQPDAAPPRAETPAAAPLPAATYVGGAACSSCHAKEHAAWQGSHHERAMAVADAATVLGRFAGTRFSHQGVTSTFFQREGRFFVNTDGPDGKLADFEVAYTFGVEPLQQYLIALPGGRLQALGIAWDSRPEAKGGQRWFHLYPDRKLRAGDALHWTGIDQVWNYQCADCHSTNLRKNYDEASNRYATTWTDINVSCEACHGPGSNHLAWAKKQGDWARFDGPGKGLPNALDERRDVAWTLDASTGNAARSKPRQTSREIETCARCHARRGQFSDDWHAGNRFADGFRTQLIEPGLFYEDGQQRDEVFNHGSFQSSKMHAQGVTCSDCHDPHTQKPRAPGNAVCSQCHTPLKYDAAEHHRHAPGSKGAECAACHMPTTTYMVVDPRHDHGFRIPRPDRTVSLGVPNACNQCHTDRKPQWAAAAVAAWYPQPKPGFQTFTEALAAGSRGTAGAAGALAAVVEDRSLPGFARASAVLRMGQRPNPAALPVLRDALADPDPLVRAAAASALAAADPASRAQWLAPLLADPVRQVRMDAARALAGAPESRLPPQHRDRFAAAIAEYVAAERFNADRPEGRANLGNLHATQGRFDEAVAAYRSAIALDPSFEQAALNLADVYRSRGAEAQAEQTLRELLARNPGSAPGRHALGLSLTRQQRGLEALQALEQAAKLSPESARFAYVYAVALNSAGQRAPALRELQRASRQHPDDPDLLLALALFERDSGNRERALGHAKRLAAVEADNPEAQQLVRELSGPPR